MTFAAKLSFPGDMTDLEDALGEDERRPHDGVVGSGQRDLHVRRYGRGAHVHRQTRLKLGVGLTNHRPARELTSVPGGARQRSKSTAKSPHC